MTEQGILDTIDPMHISFVSKKHSIYNPRMFSSQSQDIDSLRLVRVFGSRPARDMSVEPTNKENIAYPVAAIFLFCRMRRIRIAQAVTAQAKEKAAMADMAMV